MLPTLNTLIVVMKITHASNCTYIKCGIQPRNNYNEFSNKSGGMPYKIFTQFFIHIVYPLTTFSL